MSDVMSVERERNLRRRHAYNVRAATCGIDYDDRDARARRGRELLASIARRIPRHRSLVPITGTPGHCSISHAR